MKIKSIDHIAIATQDPDGFRHFLESLLGIVFAGSEVVEREGVTTHFYPVDDVNLELLEPLNGESGVARFIEKRGPGLHHIALSVEGLDEMVAKLKQAGIQFTTEAPVPGAHNKRIIFIHPKSAGGVLVELSEQAAGS
ncbi:MAG: methylmalonyl-CoA epimerase [Candidatus Marinimicrobia bacterium]|nr:methylmalonyl-CoA epimerase [Candidatus Neomarinimicrobiota bacterium]MCF7840751.1 methylmalonyl-CoA epimerase [Candidatus Neomarinimicrobiota bacterium]MCF7902759.1 methylmalonyl-CoA epimerase [Candidatus Neomarinimicrobiota bacterium]